jgi:hypothetical protein
LRRGGQTSVFGFSSLDSVNASASAATMGASRASLWAQ